MESIPFIGIFIIVTTVKKKSEVSERENYFVKWECSSNVCSEYIHIVEVGYIFGLISRR